MTSPSDSLSSETDVFRCPKCGGIATESMALATRRVLGGYFWHCTFPEDPTVDCMFEGPVKPTSAEALAAWNEIPR